MNQKIVERTVTGGAVNIDGQWFVPPRYLRDGRNITFLVGYDLEGVKKVHRVTQDERIFQEWKENSQRCNYGAKES